MSERSKAFQSKKALLDQKEREIRMDLEESSTKLEGRAKKVLTIALIAGGVALLGYLAYKAFSKPDVEETEEEKPSTTAPTKKVTKASPTSALGAVLTERLLTTGLNLLMAKLAEQRKPAEGKSED